MFIGEYSHSLDEKGRISIPAKFRLKLSEGLVLTRGLDGCLWIYPQEIWERLAERISGLPITQKDARSFSRLMLSGAVDLNLDKTGRINIPKYLLDYAGIKNKVAFAGMYDRIEVWPEDKWREFTKSMEEKSDEIAENLSELNI